MRDGDAVAGRFAFEKCNNELTTVTIEALVEREDFPSGYAVRVVAEDAVFSIDCVDMVQSERLLYQRSSISILKSAINKWYVANKSCRARVLDVGGRARSGANLRSEFKNCDFKILDIMSDEDVDFVADAHSMSQTLNGETFDIVVSASTFEHLLMPWKVALEINKILTLGGYVFVVTHQCVGMHDLPHDYLRFSSDSWKSFFNADTGFKIVETCMNDFVRVVPCIFTTSLPSTKRRAASSKSVVLAKKIGNSTLDWPVDARSIERTQYPA